MGGPALPPLILGAMECPLGFATEPNGQPSHPILGSLSYEVNIES